MLPPDILITRCRAHLNHLSNRILKEKKKAEFNEAMVQIISNIRDAEALFMNIGIDKHGGIKLAIEVVEEIASTTNERFVEGRSGDFYMEKL